MSCMTWTVCVDVEYMAHAGVDLWIWRAQVTARPAFRVAISE